jgi:hypothetical protein
MPVWAWTYDNRTCHRTSEQAGGLVHRLWAASLLLMTTRRSDEDQTHQDH